jgi:tripartite-type tricarboxylate transporter receptor subunit TctC
MTMNSFLTRRQLLQSAVALPTAATSLGVLAQTPVSKIIISWPPGGLTDAVARLLAEKLSASLKRNIIVQNRPGAGGQVGTAQFKSMPPDGETVLLASVSEAMLSAVTYSKLPYDPEKDLLPISLIADFPFVLATPVPGPNSLNEFMSWAKQNSKNVSIGCAGTGTPSYYHGIMLGKKGGFESNMIPFLGGAPLMTAVAGGHVAAAMNAFGPDMINMHRAGRTRIVGITGDQRSGHPEFTGVPTFSELGLPTIPSGWFGLFLPAGASAQIVQAWNIAVTEVLKTDEIRARFNDFGLTARSSTSQGLGDLMRRDTAIWNDVFKVNDFQKIS